jgi:MFS transporter, AAHS family, 4-hydroxybenzoate transporter
MSVIDGTFDVSGFIDAQPVRGRQYAVAVLCALVMFLDGLDTQSISYAAPLIAKEWALPHQVLGPIFSSALAGLTVGYLFISPLSDRFGHRRMMIVSTIAFGLFTALNALTINVTESPRHSLHGPLSSLKPRPRGRPRNGWRYLEMPARLDWRAGKGARQAWHPA